MTAEEQLDQAILDLGLSLEQVGPDGAVEFEIDEDGEIALYLGGERELHTDLADALERIGEWGEEYGGDPDRPGAIVELVEAIERALAEAEDVNVVFEIDIDPMLDAFALEPLDFEEAEDDNTIGVFQDANGAVWRVFVDADDSIAYENIDEDEIDE
ncbi:MAG: hypothetical protein KC503_45840 [Myxococcales bacterium]|nr:hypothetical protein [Myxococcales bacterium]